MGVLEFNRGGNGNGWNYAHPDKEGFMPSIQGTVVEIKEVPATKFNSNEIDTWPNGDPKLNVCLTIQGQSGKELDWVFSPGGSQKPTPAMTACQAALEAAGETAESIAQLAGKMIQVATQVPPQGFNYGQGNPRPWSVQILGPGTAQFRGVQRYEAGNGQAQQQQAQAAQQPVQQQPVAPVQAQPVYSDGDIPF